MQQTRKNVQVWDMSVVNYRQKNGLSGGNDRGEPFFKANIPWKYKISTKSPRRDNYCPLEGLKWIAQDYRPPADPIPKFVDVSALEDLPICGVDEKPVLGCVDGNDVKAMAENNAKGKDQRLPVCGQCDVDDQLFKHIDVKEPLFTYTVGNKKKVLSSQLYKMTLSEFTDRMNKTMARFGINSCHQKAHFIAQTAHETSKYQTTFEVDSGKQYNGRRALGNDCPNDGLRFKGKGLIQMTGRYNNFKSNVISNYTDNNRLKVRADCSTSALSTDTRLADAVGLNKDKTFETAGWYWTKGAQGDCAKKYQKNINSLINARPNDHLSVTKCVNGGVKGKNDRKKLFNKIKTFWSLP